MTKSDGTVLVQTTYEFEYPVNRDVIYFTVAGVNLGYDLNTFEALPISDADRQRLQQWDVSEDAALTRDVLGAIIDGASDQPFEVLQNYYAVALLMETGSTSASGPRISDRSRTALHHAIGKLRTRAALLSRPGFEQEIGCLGSVVTKASRTRLISLIQSGCFGGCGPGCRVLRDRYGAPMYGQPCANHDACVGPYGGYLSSIPFCQVQWGKAVLYVWYRRSSWSAYFHYN